MCTVTGQTFRVTPSRNRFQCRFWSRNLICSGFSAGFGSETCFFSGSRPVLVHKPDFFQLQGRFWFRNLDLSGFNAGFGPETPSLECYAGLCPCIRSPLRGPPTNEKRPGTISKRQAQGFLKVDPWFLKTDLRFLLLHFSMPQGPQDRPEGSQGDPGATGDPWEPQGGPWECPG